MTREKKITLFLIILILGFIAVYVKEISAQDSSTGLVVAPSHLSHTIEAGSEFVEELRVTNHRSTDEDIYITSREVEITEEGEYFVPKGYEKGNVSSFEQRGWLIFEPRHFFLKKGEGKILKVKIQMPENMPTKGYYLELAVSTRPPEDLDGFIGISPEVAIPIALNYIGIGDEIANLEIVSFETDKVLYEYPPVNFTTILSNKGNVHVVPVGQIFISRNREFVNNDGSLEFNPIKHRVFMGAGRSFENTWNEGFITIREDKSLQVDWNKLTKFRIGKYYAKLDVAWDRKEGKEFISAETSFWIFPWKILLIILILLSLIFAFISLKKRKKRGVKKYQK